MSVEHDKHAEALMSEKSGGWLNNFLADEDELDRRALWRLGSWGVGTVGAMVLGILAMQSPAAMRRDQLATVDMAQQSQQVQWIAKESQNNARQLAAAVEILNSDRDRLYARVTVLEQGLDSVTGSVARQNAAANSAPSAEIAALPKVPDALPPKIAPVASVPAAATAPNAGDPKTASSSAEKSDLAATGAVATSEPTSDSIAKPVQRTEFGVDLGGANSVEGLRALWRGVSKSNGSQLASLTPIIVVKERNDGLGMQLRLVAGPLNDAAATAKICATLSSGNRPCETAIYNGQRLTFENSAAPDTKQQKRRTRAKSEDAAPAQQKGGFSSIFGGR